MNSTPDMIGFNKSNFGLLAGYDADLAPHFTVGLVGGYLNATLDPSDSTSQAGVTGYQMGLYGRRQWGDFYVSLVGGYTLDSFKVTRTVTIGTDVNSLAGSYNGGQISGAVQLGARLTDVDTTFLPLAGVRYAHLSENGFTETGSDSLNLVVPAQAYDSLRPYAGLGETWTLNMGKNAQLIPGIHATVSQELMGGAVEVATHFAGAPEQTFTVGDAAPSATVFGVGGGLKLALGPHFNLALDYNGYFSASQSLSTVSGGVNLAF